MTVKGVVDGRSELRLVRLEEQIAFVITGARQGQVCSSAVRHVTSSLGLQILCMASKLACHRGCKAPLRFTLQLQSDWMLRLLPAEVPPPAVLRLAPDTAAKIHLPILCQQLNTTVTALSTAAPAFCLRVNGVRIA